MFSLTKLITDRHEAHGKMTLFNVMFQRMTYLSP